MKNFILLILCFICTQCVFLEDDDVLPKAMPFTGNQLKTNGYYYQSSYDYMVRPYFLYDNGILISIGGGEKTFEELDDYIRKNYVRDSWYKRNKYVWGVFFVYNNRISINRLSEDYPHRGYVLEGIILNDTTFHLTKFYSENREQELNEIYCFREFYPKPDSINKYIK